MNVANNCPLYRSDHRPGERQLYPPLPIFGRESGLVYQEAE